MLDNVKCEHMILCVALSWEDPNSFRQGSDTVQFDFEGLLWLQSVCGDELEGLRRGRQTSWRLLQPGRGTWAKGMAEELERDG